MLIELTPAYPLNGAKTKRVHLFIGLNIELKVMFLNFPFLLMYREKFMSANAYKVITKVKVKQLDHDSSRRRKR